MPPKLTVTGARSTRRWAAGLRRPGDRGRSGVVLERDERGGARIAGRVRASTRNADQSAIAAPVGRTRARRYPGRRVAAREGERDRMVVPAIRVRPSRRRSAGDRRRRLVDLQRYGGRRRAALTRGGAGVGGRPLGRDELRNLAARRRGETIGVGRAPPDRDVAAEPAVRALRARERVADDRCARVGRRGRHEQQHRDDGERTPQAVRHRESSSSCRRVARSSTAPPTATKASPPPASASDPRSSSFTATPTSAAAASGSSGRS